MRISDTNMDSALWDRPTFLSRLRAVGRDSYHDKHPFHRRMNAGELTPDQLRAWVVNRFYYQRNIPVKDAAILSNCPLPEVRRVWVRRLLDHDGREPGQGGIEAWLRLAEAMGLNREEVWQGQKVLPGARFAVDAYVQFARSRPWPVAVASSLTELFAPDLMSERLAAFATHYTWVPSGGLAYFRARLTQAQQDAKDALAITLAHCTTATLQQEAVAALAFKCEVLWAMLDALLLAHDGRERESPSKASSGWEEGSQGCERIAETRS